MKIIRTVLALITLLSFSHVAFSQVLLAGGPDEQGVRKASGEYNYKAFVECLDDVDGDGIGDGNYIYIDVSYDVLFKESQNGPTWMFSAQWRQWGTAYSLDADNNIKDTWTFNGHWKVNETSADPDWESRQHITVVENDIFIADTDAPNLKLTYTREVMWRDGVEVKRNSDLSVTCLNN